MAWPDDINRALAFMEQHLTEELAVRDIAAQAYLSPFHFQRVFSACVGMGVSEYLRRRRLTQAAQALRCPGAKVIDVALQYGYDTPESFCRAFKRQHGITPTEARCKSARLYTLQPVTIHVKQEGQTMLEYKIVEKPQFTVVGCMRRFWPDTSRQDIPAFWTELMADHPPVWGKYGVCLDEDSDDGSFGYMIADDFLPGQEIPAGCVTHVIPGCMWAVFPCRGQLPECLQAVNDKIWSEWLPQQRDYRLAASMNIELYTPRTDDGDYCEIWLPVAHQP